MLNKESKWTLKQLVVNRIGNCDDATELQAGIPRESLESLQNDVVKVRDIRALKLKRIATEMSNFPTGDSRVCVLQYVHHMLDVTKTISLWLLDQVKKGNISLNDTAPFLYILKAHRNDGVLESLWDCYNPQQQQLLVNLIMASGVLFSDLLSRDNVAFCEVIWLRSSVLQRANILNERFLVASVAMSGVHSTLEWLWPKTNPAQRQHLLTHTNGIMRPIDRAVSTGNLLLCIWLYQQLITLTTPSNLLENVLSLALENRCFNIAKWAWDTADDQVKMQMFLKLHILALTDGRFAMQRIEWLFQNLDEQFINAIFMADNCCLFRTVVALTKTNLVCFLWQHANDKQKQALFSAVNFDDVLQSDPEIEEDFKQVAAVIKASQVNSQPATDPRWSLINRRDTLYFFTQRHPNFSDPDDQDEHTYDLELIK